MTHNDIYTKYVIEYDKANVTSSYPSLTEYEVATVLDKAYNALIAQKVTGNNIRRSSVESDIKSISDLQPLIVHSTEIFTNNNTFENANNIATLDVPEDFLYFVQLNITQNNNHNNSENSDWIFGDTFPIEFSENAEYDNPDHRLLPVRLVPHQVAEKFFSTPYNMPWIKIPVVYIENGKANVVYDELNKPNVNVGDSADFVYIKKPNLFINDLRTSTKFECNDTFADELVSLAVAFSLENVESSRLNSKLNMRGLEA